MSETPKSSSGTTAVAPAPAGESPPRTSVFSRFFGSPFPLYAASTALRVVLLLYGLWQDANSPVKYTDIDYLVFTDAARYVSRGQSPYARETYRYTPLLAWMLLPTTVQSSSKWMTVAWFSSGKVLFAVADLVAGWLVGQIVQVLYARPGGGAQKVSPVTMRIYAAMWLLNPMVATISTRGSSEGLLGVLVMALLWAVLSRRTILAAFLLGFSVHFKIYPFIYAPAIVWWMDDENLGLPSRKYATEKQKKAAAGRDPSLQEALLSFLNSERIKLALVSFATFMGLNVIMFIMYGKPFLEHTYFHHVTRVDHRHNFSPYNILLYLTSAHPDISSFRMESVAFLPQILLSCVFIPLVMAKKNLPVTMLAQTFAFVTFNKVCTSQYFLWYWIFSTLYHLPNSCFRRNKTLAIAAPVLWVGTQALWLQQAFSLEFLGLSTFVPGLWLSSLAFFIVNCGILGLVISDVADSTKK